MKTAVAHHRRLTIPIHNLIDSLTYAYDANKNIAGETHGGVMSGFSGEE